MMSKCNEKCEKYRNTASCYEDIIKDSLVMLYDNETILSEIMEELDCKDKEIELLNSKLVEANNMLEETRRILANDERKLTIINSHWYGRAAIRLYRFLKKIQRFLREKGLWIEIRYRNKLN